MNKRLTSILLIFSLFLYNAPVLAQDKLQASDKEEAFSTEKIDVPSDFNLNQMILPSEVKSIGKTSGSIYFSSSVKGKVLMPVNVWGEISKSGLHFFPVDTTLIGALSMAGGASATGHLERVKVSRIENGVVTSEEFNLERGGSAEAYVYKLKPGDTIFIPKERFYENRSYYTSLFGVVATVLSSILLYRQVQKITP
jgi:hypothetical protein